MLPKIDPDTGLLRSYSFEDGEDSYENLENLEGGEGGIRDGGKLADPGAGVTANNPNQPQPSSKPNSKNVFGSPFGERKMDGSIVGGNVASQNQSNGNRKTVVILNDRQHRVAAPESRAEVRPQVCFAPAPPTNET